MASLNSNSMQPLVSVIIPAYNCAEFVSHAIDSVLKQNYENKEIIVVNDGSTDDTPDVLESFGDQITVVNKENGGAPTARNAGLRIARGKYIAFLDADDLWFDGKLTMQVRYLEEHPDVGMVYNSIVVWNLNDTGESEFPAVPASTDYGPTIEQDGSGWLYNKLLLDCMTHTTAVMVRATVTERVGEFDERLTIGEDYDYWIRISREAKIHKLTAVLSVYHSVPDSLSRTVYPVNFEFQVVQKALDRWGLIGPDGTKTRPRDIRHRKAKMHFNFAYSHWKAGSPMIAFKSALACVSNRPTWCRAWALVTISLLKAMQFYTQNKLRE